MSNEASMLSLRELDQRNQAVKGTSFRAFKRIEPQLVEGIDFVLIDPNSEKGQALLAENKAYPSSRVIIMVTERAYAAMQQAANLQRL